MGPKMQNLREGMSEQEVIEQLGSPDGLLTDGDYRALKWSNQLMSGWSNDRAGYWVILREGRIVAYGPGEVRPGPRPGVLVLFPAGEPR